MSRTVSTPLNAAFVIYFPFDDGDDDDAELYFRDMIDDIRGALTDRFPSLRHADSWLGREDHVILENDLCSVTLSEYCGLCALAFVPYEGESFYVDDIARANLAGHWCTQAENGAREALKHYTQLVKIGTASNGEAFYRAIA